MTTPRSVTNGAAATHIMARGHVEFSNRNIRNGDADTRAPKAAPRG